MKTIGIITYPRTGSNWLGDILYGSNVLYVGELFCGDYLEFFRKIADLLNLYKVEPKIIETFIKIYNRDNFYVDRILHNKLYDIFTNQKIYNIDLLEAFKQQAYSLNKHFIFKFFYEHQAHGITTLDIINNSDHILLNYRQNLLASFISLQKAIIDDQWSYTLDNNFKQLNTKIVWKKDSFIEYRNFIIDNINKTISLLKIHNKPYHLVCYETLHSLTLDNKKQYLQQILGSTITDLQFNIQETFLKQTSKDSKLIDYIENIEDFQKDIKDIEHTLII